MDIDSMLKSLAENGPIHLRGGHLDLPIIPGRRPPFPKTYNTHRLDYATDISLTKIHLYKNALGNFLASDWITERALGKIQWEMNRLRNAGIPVFIDERDEISFNPSFVQSYIWNYSIPESMLYKRFFALHDFDTAVKEAAAHARQKIYEFIDNW